jgi:hypothetical protein
MGEISIGISHPEEKIAFWCVKIRREFGDFTHFVMRRFVSERLRLWM